MQLKYIQNCGQESKAKRTQQLPLKRLLKHFKNFVRSTFLIVCLKDGKLIKLTDGTCYRLATGKLV